MSDSLEGNKIAAAILLGGVIAMGSGFVAELIYHPTTLANPVYAAVDPDAEAASEADGSTEEVPALSLSEQLATADPAAGEKLAKRCKACHSFDNGGPQKVGPNLWDIVNRPIGTVGGFSYSAGMAALSNEAWDYQHLADFLANPKGMIQDTKMAFNGLRKPQQVADMLAYLRSLSDNPAALP